jgi:hypothetical protein
VMEKGWRIVLDNDPLPGLDPADQPRRLRVHIPNTSGEFNPGDRVSLRAMLYPVPAQILPGGRDFQRELYFAGIGGVGYTFGAAHRTTEPEATEQEAVGVRICANCAPIFRDGSVQCSQGRPAGLPRR